MLRSVRRLFSTPLSYVKGDTSVPLSPNSISKQFFMSSLSFAQNTAVISDFQNIEVSYQNLFALARRMAGNMLDLGIQKGAKVGIYSPNNFEWLLSQYACALADLHMVNINPAYKPLELKHGVNLVEIENLIVTNTTLPKRILDNVEHFMGKGQAFEVFSDSEKG